MNLGETPSVEMKSGMHVVKALTIVNEILPCEMPFLTLLETFERFFEI